MKKLLVITLTVFALGLSASPAGAWTTTPPTWVGGTGAPANFSWDYWIQCNPNYREYDCIDSVNWIKADGTSVAGKWVAAPGFNYASQKITWVMNGSESAQYFNERIQNIGGYQFDGLQTPCGDNVIYADVRPVQGSMQVNSQSTCAFLFQSKFEEKFQYTLKSKALKGFIGGISSNGKDPGVLFVEKDGFQYITISAQFARIPWNDAPGGGPSPINFCDKNMGRAGSAGWGLWNSLHYINSTGYDSWLSAHPGDMITGTNGWNCGGSLQWDAESRSLVMQVGAPHFYPDGTVTDGWFEGRIRGAMIKSKFNIDPAKAALSAKLEIIYGEGDSKVATMSTSYDSKGDWLFLKAYGFEYSNPKLRLTFGASANVAKTTTITCVKGKTSKKVTGTKPVCPKGYLKK